jgi:pimeloyl-ACP methyl ester carboxylesterase
MITQLRQIRHHVRETSGSVQANTLAATREKCRDNGGKAFEVSDHGSAWLYRRAAGVGDRGEPILLIHGFASTHAVNWVFPQWVKTLTRAGGVVAFDNRGHGRSENSMTCRLRHAEDGRGRSRASRPSPH